MAKGIREHLLEQAIKFHQWQKATYPGKTAEEIGGEWEVDYPYWNDTYRAFCHVLTQMDAETADIHNGLSASAAGPQPPMRMRPSGSLLPICRNAHVVRKSGI